MPQDGGTAHCHAGRKRLLWGGILAAAVLAAIVLAVLLQRDGEPLPTADEMNRVVITGDGFSLTNTELNYYFWNEYFYLADNAGASLDGSLDTGEPLSQQMYDETQTWEDHILQLALETIQSTKAMVMEAEQAGFTLPEESAASMETVLERFSDSAVQKGCVKEDGTPDLDAYLAGSYGPGASMESFRAYLEDSYLAAAYLDALRLEPEFTEEEISDYYDLFAADYAAEGVEKDDTRLRNIREIVFTAASGDSAGQDEARSAAETLLATWQAESGGEADFAALAEMHSGAASAGEGGLLSDLAPGDLEDASASWVFDEARQPGDVTVLETGDGWTLLYYVGESERTVWQKAAEANLRQEACQDAYRAACDRWAIAVDDAAICIAAPQEPGSGAESLSSGN